MRLAHIVISVFASCIVIHASTTNAACNIVDGKAYGDCNNIQVNTSNKQSLEVHNHVSETRIINGATIFPGGFLLLSGTSNDDIIVNKGGTLYVSGIVNGVVKNFGGTVKIEGSAKQVQTNGGRVIIGGIVESIAGNGDITYKKGAIIGGVPTGKTIRIGGKR